MQRFVRTAAAALLSGLLLLPSARGVCLTLDGQPLDIGQTPVYQDTTFVSVRALVETVSPDAYVAWTGERAEVVNGWFSLAAQPGDTALVCNGQRWELGQEVRLENGRTLVPLRPLAALLGLEVEWNAATGVVELTSPAAVAEAVEAAEPATADTAAVTPGGPDDDLYWLSRIISAESQGECREGKIAVGNVVLNRVASPDFPDSIYDVIFDARWGGQFEPVRNGSIYRSPTPESVEAARACLAGENTAGDSLYFLAPDLTENHWVMENQDYVTTIGVHWFYQ